MSKTMSCESFFGFHLEWKGKIHYFFLLDYHRLSAVPIFTCYELMATQLLQ